MNKKKYIERKSGQRSAWNQLGFNRQRDKQKKQDELPFRESMRFNSRKDWEKHQEFYNYNHIENFIKERIGYNWNDVYSEILSKLKKKYKYKYRENQKWPYFIETNIIFVDDLPHSISNYRYLKYSLMVKNIFVDENNIVSYYETKEKLINEYRLRLRRKKLSNIMNDDY